MIVGGYSLHLYCDGGTESGMCPNKARSWESLDAEFDGDSKADCYSQARRAGWKLRAGRAICPKCAKEGRK